MNIDASDDGHNVVFVLADALWSYNEMWDEDSGERWNLPARLWMPPTLDQRAAFNEALDMARRLGWTPQINQRKQRTQGP